MTSQSKIGPNGTYILDDSDLAQLEELSFTAVIDEASVPAQGKPAVDDKPETAGSDQGAHQPERQDDTEINALLDDLD